MGGALSLLGAILSSKNRDMFTVRLAATLLVGGFGISGFGAALLVPLIAGTLGLLVEKGILKIDLLLDAYREGAKIPEFHKDATAAYEWATARVYDEAKKAEIRRKYLEIISRIGAVGDGPK